jgi:hypothetical protein
MRDLKADLALCEAATPGPWGYKDDGYGNYFVSALLTDDDRVYRWSDIPFSESDVQFIAAAREGWPEAILRALKAEDFLDHILELVKQGYQVECIEDLDGNALIIHTDKVKAVADHKNELDKLRSKKEGKP